MFPKVKSGASNQLSYIEILSLVSDGFRKNIRLRICLETNLRCSPTHQDNGETVAGMPSELLGDGLIQTGLAKEIVGEPKALVILSNK